MSARSQGEGVNGTLTMLAGAGKLGGLSTASAGKEDRRLGKVRPGIRSECGHLSPLARGTCGHLWEIR